MNSSIHVKIEQATVTKSSNRSTLLQKLVAGHIQEKPMNLNHVIYTTTCLNPRIDHEPRLIIPVFKKHPQINSTVNKY